MAEDAGTITRQALGRIAWLGDLYDARSDKFCAMSLLKERSLAESTVRKRDNPHCNISFTTTSSEQEKLKILEVKADLQLSVLAGMVQLGGSAKYLDEKKDSFKSVESALVYNITTVVERLDLDLFDEKVRAKFIAPEAMCRSGATHVVLAIYWGANCAITVTDQNSEDEDKAEVEVALKAHLEQLKTAVSVGGEAKVGRTRSDRDTWNKFSLKIFGDVSPEGSDEFPTTLDGAIKMMRKMPELVRRSNSGKGKPLKYVMLPLSNLNIVDGLSFTNVNEGQIIEVVHLFSYLRELKQKAHDHVEELSGHSRSVTTGKELREAQKYERDLAVQEGRLRSELKKCLKRERSETNGAVQELERIKSELEQCLRRVFSESNEEENGAVQELGRLRSELEKCLKAIHSDSADENGEEELAALCKRHYEMADATFGGCEKIYREEEQQIMFAKRCKKFGVKFLTPPIDERIASAFDKYENVYVLFDDDSQTLDEEDRKARMDNHTAFIELAKINQHNRATVCYVTWPDKSSGSKNGRQEIEDGRVHRCEKVKVRIEHHRKGKSVDKDVVKELLESKDLAKCVTAARRAHCLVPFRARCPGSVDGDCSREERSWTCIECKETLELCLGDGAFYCSCGHANAKQFRFQCHSEAHGTHFLQFSDDRLQAVLEYHASLFYKAVGVKDKISTEGVYVLGVTSVDDELFLLLERHEDQVGVYSVNDYQLLRHLNVPGLAPDINSDIASGVRHRCLYMSDCGNKYILRYDLGDSASCQWSVPGIPRSLSVTSDSNLLVTCWGRPNRLVELSADSGQCVHEIALQPDTEYPAHGVKLTTGQFVVCLGFPTKCLYQVCLVSFDGKITRSYGGESYGSDFKHCPYELAVDNESQSIFVADARNHRVSVLSSASLESVVDELSTELSEPCRLHFDEATRRLFVGQGEADIAVIQA